MCRVEEKTYIYPDGEQRLVTTKRYCSKSDGKTLCHDHEREKAGRVFIQPDLVDDENLPSPSSANFPPTPDSANLEYREPPSSGRRSSTSDRHGKGRRGSSSLRIKIRKDSPMPRGRHGHTLSTGSAASSAAGSSTSIPAYKSPIIPPLEELSFDVAPESPKEDPGSPAEQRRRRRIRPIVTNLQPNPPPGSVSGSSSHSPSLHSAGRDEPRSSDTDRRHAQDRNAQEERQRRRELREGKRPAHASSPRVQTSAEREAEEIAKDEYARKDYERVQGREERRRENKERQEREDRRREEEERREGYASSSGKRRLSENRRPSVHYAEPVEQIRYVRVPADSSSRTSRDSEDARRREQLARQLRDARPVEEVTSPRDPTVEARRRTNEVEAELRAEYERQRRRTEAQPSQPHGQYPPQAFRQQYHTETRYPQDHHRNRRPEAGTSYSDPALDRRWHVDDVSARVPGRTNSTRQPRQRRNSISYSAVSGPANFEVRQPGGSASNSSPAWVHNIEARRVRGEQVLADARARAEFAEREAAARHATQMMAQAMQSQADQYPEGSPEWWYYTTGRPYPPSR